MRECDITNQHIGRQLTRVRRAAGLSLRQLAAQLGWPHTTLANYESGRRALRVTHLMHIAATLQQPPATLLDMTCETDMPVMEAS